MTKGFSVDDLRSFNETIPLPFEDITLKAKTKCSTYDIFPTGVSYLRLVDMKNCTLTVPTCVVKISLSRTDHVTVSGADNVTRLSSVDISDTTVFSPKLREMDWQGEKHIVKSLPVHDIQCSLQCHYWQSKSTPTSASRLDCCLETFASEAHPLTFLP